MASAKVHNGSAFNTTESVVWDKEVEKGQPPMWWDFTPTGADALLRITGSHLDPTDDAQRIPVSDGETFEWLDNNQEITKIEVDAPSGSGTYVFRPKSGI